MMGFVIVPMSTIWFSNYLAFLVVNYAVFGSTPCDTQSSDPAGDAAPGDAGNAWRRPQCTCGPGGELEPPAAMRVRRTT